MLESSCVLKSVIDKEADNLFYEYMVGAWLNNKINENFPFQFLVQLPEELNVLKKCLKLNF